VAGQKGMEMKKFGFRITYILLKNAFFAGLVYFASTNTAIAEEFPWATTVLLIFLCLILFLSASAIDLEEYRKELEGK
jgi:hypothetical protein